MNQEQFNQRMETIRTAMNGMDIEELIVVSDVAIDRRIKLENWARDVADTEIIGQFNLSDTSVVAMRVAEDTFFLIGDANCEEVTLDSHGHQITGDRAEYLTRLMAEVL